MPELDSKEADDRVLPLTRGIAAGIVPFLVVAFVVLYLWPVTLTACSPGPSSRR